MLEDAVQLGLVPVWHRNRFWASDQTVPGIFYELDPLRRRELENLFKKVLGSHGYKMGILSSAGKGA